jgi:hypothetical protein
LHMAGLLFLLVALTKKLFSFDYSNFHSAGIVTLGFLAILLYLLSRYYSPSKSDVVLSEFQSFRYGIRRLWGVVAVATLLSEYVAIALLLSK